MIRIETAYVVPKKAVLSNVNIIVTDNIYILLKNTPLPMYILPPELTIDE